MKNFTRFNEVDLFLIENACNYPLPESVANHFLTVGYGFLKNNTTDVNRFLAPTSIMEFYEKNAEWIGYEGLSEYYSYAIRYMRLPFFELDNGIILSIGLSQNEVGKVFYLDEIVADSLKEFIANLQSNKIFLL